MKFNNIFQVKIISGMNSFASLCGCALIFFLCWIRVDGEKLFILNLANVSFDNIIISPGSSRIVNGTDAEEGEFPFAVN